MHCSPDIDIARQGLRLNAPVHHTGYSYSPVLCYVCVSE